MATASCPERRPRGLVPTTEADATAPARGRVLAYGCLGLPLAFAALPIYVHVPAFYAEQLGLSLALVGGVLLAVRALDAASDPLIGWAVDHVASRRTWIGAGLPVLALGLCGLLLPPPDAGAAWLAAMLVLVSLGHSAVSIAYHAWAAEMPAAGGLRLRLVACREAFALVGVVTAAILPAVLSAGIASLAWAFLPLLAAGAAVTMRLGPAPVLRRASAVVMPLAVLSDAGFRRLLVVYALNGIAAAIPASTVLFYIADVLRAETRTGLFLALYFVAAALSLPLWVRIARSVGELRAWLLGMALAIAVFGWAWTLGPGAVLAYAAICALSGVALGADLALPSVLLANLLGRERAASATCSKSLSGGAGAWFGWWNFIAKANLALAAGVVLPLLGWFGYTPGARDAAAVTALAGLYAALPVMLKLGAAALLWCSRSQLAEKGDGRCETCW